MRIECFESNVPLLRPAKSQFYPLPPSHSTSPPVCLCRVRHAMFVIRPILGTRTAVCRPASRNRLETTGHQPPGRLVTARLANYPAQYSLTSGPSTMKQTKDTAQPKTNPHAAVRVFGSVGSLATAYPMTAPTNGATSIVIPITGISMSAVFGSSQSRSLISTSLSKTLIRPCYPVLGRVASVDHLAPPQWPPLTFRNTVVELNASRGNSLLSMVRW